MSFCFHVFHSTNGKSQLQWTSSEEVSRERRRWSEIEAALQQDVGRPWLDQPRHAAHGRSLFWSCQNHFTLCLWVCKFKVRQAKIPKSSGMCSLVVTVELWGGFHSLEAAQGWSVFYFLLRNPTPSLFYAAAWHSLSPHNHRTRRDTEMLCCDKPCG